MSNHSPKARRVIAATLALSLALSNFFAFRTNSILAAENTTENAIENIENMAVEGSRENSQQVGQMIVTGTVTVNEKKAITGTTVFTDSRIAVACAKGNSAIVNLGRLGRVELSAGSKLMLRFGEGIISGDLLAGKAVVSTPAGVKVAVNTPEGVSSTDGKEAAVTPVATQRGVRCVPIAVSSSGSASALGNGPLAALLVGIGGAAAAGAVVASSESESTLSPSLP